MMKNDLLTSILVAILGIVISYLICNTFYGRLLKSGYTPRA